MKEKRVSETTEKTFQNQSLHQESKQKDKLKVSSLCKIHRTIVNMGTEKNYTNEREN